MPDLHFLSNSWFQWPFCPDNIIHQHIPTSSCLSLQDAAGESHQLREAGHPGSIRTQSQRHRQLVGTAWHGRRMPGCTACIRRWWSSWWLVLSIRTCLESELSHHVPSKVPKKKITCRCWAKLWQVMASCIPTFDPWLLLPSMTWAGRLPQSSGGVRSNARHETGCAREVAGGGDYKVELETCWVWFPMHVESCRHMTWTYMNPICIRI